MRAHTLFFSVTYVENCHSRSVHHYSVFNLWPIKNQLLDELPQKAKWDVVLALDWFSGFLKKCSC